MLKFNHLAIPVNNWIASRDWYVNVLGLKVEFEIPQRLTAAVQDEHDFTIFLVQAPPPSNPMNLCLTFQVDDVRKTLEAISRKEVPFTHPPEKVFWGYGAELCDPDGYTVRLWDENSMKMMT